VLASTAFCAVSMRRLMSFDSIGNCFSHARRSTVFETNSLAKDAQEVIFKREVEAGGTGITWAAGESAQWWSTGATRGVRYRELCKPPTAVTSSCSLSVCTL